LLGGYVIRGGERKKLLQEREDTVGGVYYPAPRRKRGKRGKEAKNGVLVRGKNVEERKIEI